MTQTERVLLALRRAGERGITQVDFTLPNVIDGGKPITRIAARINELRNDGHRIAAAGTRDKCKVYVLEEAPTEPQRPSWWPTDEQRVDEEALF